MSGNSSSESEGTERSSKNKLDEDEIIEDSKDTPTTKKLRVAWSVELHQHFIEAINRLGVEKAVPVKILELMNVEGLSRENVSSHLQKYRLYLKNQSSSSQTQSGQQEAINGSTEALASSGQFSAAAALQDTAFSRPAATSPLIMPLNDKKNRFRFKQRSSRFGNGQQEASNNNEQVSLLQRSHTKMEPTQLANLHSTQPFLGMNGTSKVTQINTPFMQMAQVQSRGQLMNQTNGSQVPRIQSIYGQTSRLLSSGQLLNQINCSQLPEVQSPHGRTLLPNVMPRAGTQNGVERGTTHGQVSQGSSNVNFFMKQSTMVPGTSFPLMSDPGMAALSKKPVFEREIQTEIQDSRNFNPGYELPFQQTPNWSPQNVGSSSHAPQDYAFQGASGGGQNNTSNVDQVNPLFLLAGASMSVQSESLTDQGCQSNDLFSESSGQDDLFSAMLKQQDEVIPMDDEFGFVGYSLDDDFPS